MKSLNTQDLLPKMENKFFSRRQSYLTYIEQMLWTLHEKKENLLPNSQIIDPTQPKESNSKRNRRRDMRPRFVRARHRGAWSAGRPRWRRVGGRPRLWLASPARAWPWPAPCAPSAPSPTSPSPPEARNPCRSDRIKPLPCAIRPFPSNKESDRRNTKKSTQMWMMMRSCCSSYETFYLFVVDGTVRWA